MKLVNRDLTRETVCVYVTGTQIYARIWSRNKNKNKWETEEYFQSYDWEIDEELVNSTIKYIKRTWKLRNPIVRIN